jgi:adenosylcobyric acid synthase
MAKAIMILGTGSDVGKSITSAALCRILKRKGYRVAPFKAQNMSNNSFVTVEGGEIGRSQVVQAEASGLLPSVHMNPILLKPSINQSSQVVLQGRVFGQVDALDYRDYRGTLKKVIMESYRRMAKDFDIIVMEGAGSCCEMNLKKNDLVNLPLAKTVGASCILVADIDRGGVFAQIIGSYGLMTRKEREMILGFVINKFRGDPRLFQSGIEYIERKTGKPVLGLVPFYQDIIIDSEDSVAVQEDRRINRETGPRTVNIAVVRLPSISNFTDLEVLQREKDVVVNYLFRPRELSGDYTCIVLPGTKNVMEDARWLARSGWKSTARKFVAAGGTVLGICGGYQLLGEWIRDPEGVESDIGDVRGLGLLPVETVLEREKVVRRVNGLCLGNGKRVAGYEIHMGRSTFLGGAGEPFLRIHEPGKKRTWLDGWCGLGGRVSGTYVHGILDAQGFRGAFLNNLRRARGLKQRPPKQGRQARFKQYDLLADHFEAHCDVERIIAAL